MDLWYNDKWYDATIVEAKADGEYLVHYEGWDPKWDEYVCNDRLQARTKKAEGTGPQGGSENTSSGGSSSDKVVGHVRLRNHCPKSVVMRVGEKDYVIEKHSYVDIEVTEQCWISSVLNGTPTGKQLYFVDEDQIEYYADCR